MDEFICREAHHDDIDAMSGIRLSVSENILSDPSKVTLADYASYIEGAGKTWVAERAGCIVAFGSAHRSGLIWALFVRPGFEGRGLGQLIMEACLSWLEQKGVARGFLDTGAGTRAEDFYRAQGWREIGREGGMIHFELALPRVPPEIRPARPASGA